MNSTSSGDALSNLQSELIQLQHDVNLRKLVWKSIQEWDTLIVELLDAILDEVKVDILQKDVNQFTQNIYVLEKGQNKQH
jgi:dynein heavy chain